MKTKLFLFTFLLLLSFVPFGHATLVKPVNIEQLVGLSHYIVKAKVTDKKIEIDDYESGNIVAYYTLDVIEWLKGTPFQGQENEFIIKQLANGEFSVAGQMVRQKLSMPEYKIGETYVLFLPQPHAVSGLVAPIGLFQGSFKINKDETGKEMVPQFGDQAVVLAKNLKFAKKSSQLTKQLTAVGNGGDASYSTFKAMIKETMEQ